MNVYDYLGSKDALQAQIDLGMVAMKDHPSASLSILNYTQKAQYTPDRWNSVTDKCRGLIFNRETEEIVSRPFVKFWNYADARHPETLSENFPATTPSITRKMDGSMGILYRVGDDPFIATRGSFESEQAKWASKWIQSEIPNIWPLGFTPIFEIIYPENRIVVKYDWEGLVLLALVNNETGEEADYRMLTDYAYLNGMQSVEKFLKPLTECISEDHENEEGYVVSWTRPGMWPLRVKIKYETYCRLHRLLTQTNAVTVWEMLRDGQDLSALTQETPAEFIAWLTSVEASLLNKFHEIEQSAWLAMEEYRAKSNGCDDRKPFALFATQKQPLTPILFSIFDRKDYSSIIWKMIRPRGDQRTFVVDGEE